jgi:hypothetical protein
MAQSRQAGMGETRMAKRRVEISAGPIVMKLAVIQYCTVRFEQVIELIHFQSAQPRGS